MEQIKKQYLEYFDKLGTILKNIDMQNDDILVDSIKNSEFIVPIVGGFSAGKSTLLNNFLGKDILKTDTTATTAIATELRYGENERIEAITEQNTSEIFSIDDMDKINTNDYLYIRLYLNNEKLKEIYPMILVDMPGFDSTNQSHEKAINYYLEKGNYFVFLTPVTQGNITKTMLEKIKFIQQFSKGFSFCISKCDLANSEKIDEVKSYIKKQLVDECDYSDKVTIFNDKSGDEFYKMIKEINQNKLFKDIFLQDIKLNASSIENTITTKLNIYKADEEEIKNNIRAINKSKMQVESKAHNVKNELDTKYSNSAAELVKLKVISDLKTQSQSLARTALNNNEGFKIAFENTISSSLKNHLNVQLQDTNRKIIDDFMFDFSKESADVNLDFLDNQKFQNYVSDSLKDMLASMKNRANQERLSRTGGMGDGRKFVTFLAITTDFVAPWMEAVVLFLPEILSFVKSLLGKSDEAKISQIQKKILLEIIPQVELSIKNQIKDIFNENLQNSLNQIEATIKTELDEKEKLIEQEQEKIKNLKEQKQDEIIKLENAKTELEKLVKEYL